ncbi:MAG: hypothetical protein HYV41_05275 [Candidatus Magasanikbacteria bacterium]|nr:hypothetical protein [Candidatus Magasanikbacteria bacterium]
MSIKPEIQEFFVEGNDDNLSHVLLHIAEPITETEKERGYFFALIEVATSYPHQLSQIQELIANIETEYYESAHTDDAFEQVLRHANGRSGEILEYDGTEIHSVVGILQDKRVILGYHGSPQATLFYQNSQAIAYTPIIEEQTDTHPHLFSTVVEGIVHENDSIYICTPHVNEFFPAYRVKNILENKTARQSAIHIQKVLDSLKNKYSFGGILFHIPKIPITPMMELERKQGHSVAIGSQASMDKFLNTTRTTEETLMPPLLKNAKEGIQHIFSSVKSSRQSRRKKIKTQNQDHSSKHTRIETNYRPSPNQDTLITRALVGLGKSLVFLGAGLYIILKKTIFLLLASFRYLFFIITNRSGQRTIAIDNVKKFINNKKYQIDNLGIMSKVLYIALICLVFIFIISITYLKFKEDREAQAAQYTHAVDIIIEKKDEAQARLLYGEEKKALEILREAERLTDALPQKTDEEIAQARELTTTLSAILLKLQKITTVDSSIVADLSSTNEQVQIQGLVFFNDTLVAFGEHDTTLYTIDPITQTLESKSYELIKNLKIADVPKEDDKIVFITTEHKALEFNKKTQSFSSKEISFSTDNPELVDLAIYSTRLYILNAREEQIFKHNPTQIGYDRGTAWITSKTSSLLDAVSIAVDGDLYVLTSSGKILKFYAGTEQGFEIHGLDPALENPTQLWTYADVNNIYILEPTHKRVVIIDKEGNFVGQYTNEAWDDLQDFVVNESDKMIYVLSGNKIYLFGF